MNNNGTKVMAICKILVNKNWFSPVAEYELNPSDTYKDRTKVYEEFTTGEPEWLSRMSS